MGHFGQLEGIVGQHGLVCVAREAADAAEVVYKNDLLWQRQDKILIIRDWMRNDTSSTKVRLVTPGASLMVATLG